jgi:Raf kinase inhibitor-like YbhB/YbcL family protein
MKLRLAIALGIVVGCQSKTGSTPSPPKGVTPSAITVTSSAFANNTKIPVDYSCDGTDRSPEVSWTAMPDSAKSVVLVVDDPDASKGTFTHWIVWNMSPTSRMLGNGGNGGLQGGLTGTNDFGHVGYGGPCPPKGSEHHYHFRVYALDATVALKQDSKRADLDQAMSAHVVAQGELVGTFQH